MKPTTEQLQALDLFRTGKTLAIEAGAGTGKTTTLRQLGESTRKRCAYVAFNKAIVTEAKAKMPDNVAPSTAHSLAFRAVGKRFSKRLNGARMRSDQVARELGIDPFVISYGQEKKVLQPGFLAGHVMRAVARFCQSADPEPTGEHVPYIDGIDLPDSKGNRTFANNREIKRALELPLRKAWADLTKVDGRLRFSHDCYLKLWQLGEPRISAEVVFFDEAQDAAPVMLDIVERQEQAQRIYVGDSQQQIYEWRGAVNALASIPADERAFLTQSWRFGPAVAEVANLVLALLDADIRLTGTESISSVLGEAERPDAILCRSNACAVSTVMDLQEQGRRPHLVGGGDEVVRFARAARDLKEVGSTSHPELACFTSWGEVLEYVKQDAQGGELKLLVDLCERYSVPAILRALERMPSEEEADGIVSTAHKAKGREWSSVKLAEDFAKPDTEAADMGAGELRLLYVAATRARNVLDIEACGPLYDLVNPPAPGAIAGEEAEAVISGITDLMNRGQ